MRVTIFGDLRPARLMESRTFVIFAFIRMAHPKTNPLGRIITAVNYFQEKFSMQAVGSPS